MSWIQTFTGRAVRPQDPRPDELDIADIAHSLSLLCRFNGHCRVFYSVAEHSVRVSRACPSADALWGLLHDMGEAYLSDLPRPIKGLLPEFKRLEDQLLEVAASALGLCWPMPASVRLADDVLLATEARDLMADPPEPWPLTAEPLPDVIVPQTAQQAEQAFLARYAELSEDPASGV